MISGDTTITLTDTTKTVADTVKKAAKKSSLKSKVEYSSTDSLRLDLKEQKVYLYNEANIKYENLNLKAGYVEISFRKNEMFAQGVKDSTGKNTQIPEFAQGDQTFKSTVIRYNYNTKRGYIQSVFTKQDDGYLHGRVIKKMENDITYVKDGSYTTCDLEENPHFEFRFGRAKVVPGKKVITGPAFMAIANVATPLLIPFGYFPNKAGRRSGILIPTYGESANRGFYLQNGGYYWAMSQYTDLTVVGDIYSRGSWALKPIFNYKYRYHYYGTMNFSTATTVLGSEGSPDYSKTKDFRIYWVHNQDPKARPRSRFSANVNIVSNTYNKNNLSGSTQNYLSNQFQSSINYSTNWADFFYLNLNLGHSQNTLDSTISFTFPQISFSTNQVYPFRSRNRVGKKRWYENINFKYNLDAENRYRTKDNLIFAPGWEKLLENGIRHSIPISSTITLLRYINWTTGINITDRMYFQTIRKKYVINDDTSTSASLYKLITDTVQGYANAFEANFSTSMSTRLYGMYQLKAGPVMAVRHMVVPSVSFSYLPDYGSPEFGYWRYPAYDTNHVNPQKYSIFQGTIYGGPPGNKAGVVSFSIRNNLEMKVRNRKDTVTGTRKIMLIEDFTLRTSYDLARDSVNWAPVTLSGYTTLFKTLRIQYGSTWDMYTRDVRGNRTNQTQWKVNNKFLLLDATSWDLGLNYSLSSTNIGKKESDKGTEQERQDVTDNYEDYIDFDIPWSFSINYNFSFKKSLDYATGDRKSTIVQTLNFNGQFNLTPKWKVLVTSGYDFVNKEISYTRIDISRDLHCWEMRFGWTPKGYQQSWEFSINVKAPLLQDLKLNKKKDFRTAF